MKRLPVLVFMSFCFVVVYGQPSKNDSLNALFNNLKQPDSIRFDAGFTVFMEQVRINLDSARATGFKLLKLADTVQNKQWESKAQRYIGNTYAMASQYDKALDHFLKSHQLLLAMNDQKGLATIYNNIGTVYYELSNYPLAQEYLLKSLKMAETLQDDVAMARALNNLGNVHYDLTNNQKALEYYTKSLDIKKVLGQKNTLPHGYNNIALVYSNLKKHALAIDNLSKSAEIAQELGQPRAVARAYSNLGVEYSKLNRYDEALSFFNRSIAIQTNHRDTDGLAMTHLHRGQNYLALNNFNKAKRDCEKSLTMAETSGAVMIQKEACGCLSIAYEAIGNYKSALGYNQRYMILKDSLFTSEKTKEITRNEMNYQFEKKQLKDSMAYQKREMVQQMAYEKTIRKEHRRFYITLLAALVIIGFLLALYLRYRQSLQLKKVENELLNSEIEYKKKDLTNLAIRITNNQEWAESLGNQLEVLKTSTGRKRVKELENLEAEIKNKIWVNRDSNDFYKQIDELSSAFYDKLITRFKGLSKTDIRLCSLIRLNLNTKQIATLQNINPSSVKMSRNRLRKKLNLTPEEDLTAFLRAF